MGRVFTPALLLILVGSPAAVAASDCGLASCPEQSHALMQHKKAAQGMAVRPGGHRKQKAEVDHAGTVNLLLAEMNDLIASKGQTGVDPDEIAHIHSIKALIDTTIFPAIAAEVNAYNDELAELYQDVLNCEEHAGGVLNYTTTRKEVVDTVMKDTRDCEVKEDIIKKKKKKVCETLNRTRLAVYIPGGEDFPPPSVPDEELIKYLHLMDEFYCGKYELFYDEWQECEDLDENYTITHQECIKLQKEFGELSCEYKINLDKSCEYFDTCWTETVKKYNQRKKEILDVMEGIVGEYEGASKVECLWSAWIYEGMPCTVNKTRIKECHEFLPNTTNITVETPTPPPPPQCSTVSVELEVCSPEWLKFNYGDLGLAKDVYEELKENCELCPKLHSWTSAPVVTSHIHSYNAVHVGGLAYMKQQGKQGVCDAYVETDDPNVRSVELKPSDYTSEYVLEIVTESTSLKMTVNNNVAMVEGRDGVVAVHKGDKVGISLSAGAALFTENGKVFEKIEDLPEDMTSGVGKVSLCGKVGKSSAEIEFGLVN